MRRSHRLAALAAGLAAAAAAASVPAPSAAQEAAAAPALSADEIADILRPIRRRGGGGGGDAGEMPLRMRGLTAGEGDSPAPPAPGDSGSGVLPDLKILFGYDSDALSAEARAQLDQLADALRREDMREYRFLVAGHTDVVGGDAYNEDLSRRRAAAVVSYLAKGGVAGGRLAAVGMGERELADPADPTSGRNRRVEVRTQALDQAQEEPRE